MFSASDSSRVEACPASAVLPQVRRLSEVADKGSAGHEHMRDRVELGVDAAVERIDEVCARWNLSEREAGFLRSRLLKFEWSPPPGAITEIRLALMRDGRVVRVPETERFVEGALITGQFDAAWVEPGSFLFAEGSAEPRVPKGAQLWVADLKYGSDAWVSSVESNAQVSCYAYLAARWTGAEVVVPAVIYPGPGLGEWDVPTRPWGPAEIRAAGERLTRMFASVEEARERHRRGEPLRLTEGRHCEYCPAQSRCPAKIAMLRAALAGELVPEDGSGLSAAEARRLASALAQLESIGKRAKAALHVYYQEHGPVDLGDGLAWGPVAKAKTKINLTPEAQRVLFAELGAECIDTALEVDVTGASIERAVKRKLELAGQSRGVAPAVRRIYAQLGEVGALESVETTEFRVHRPKPVLDVPVEGDEEERRSA